MWFTYVCCVFNSVETFFFFNDTATTEIYTLSLHDALPISTDPWTPRSNPNRPQFTLRSAPASSRSSARRDRKSTRLNSSHVRISYAVFCLKKKKSPPSPPPFSLYPSTPSRQPPSHHPPLPL